MSITPFLPGLPAALPDTGTTPEGSADGSSADGRPAFGDALLAALAGSLAVPAASQPVVTSVAGAASALPSVHLGVSTVDLGVSTRDVGVSTVDLGVSTGELGVSPGAPTVDGDATSTSDVPAAGSPTVVPNPAPSLAATSGPISGLTSDLTSALTSTLTTAPGAVGDRVGSGDEAPAVVVPEPVGAARPTDGGPDAPRSTPDPTRDGRTDSTATTANSTVETTNSTVGNPNSRVENPNSTVESPKSTVGRAVVQQVFPEVTRLVSSSGNGTHRITLTLQPEQLGEVRVTLVVRDGSVHVRLAGAEGAEGAAVHRALAGGAPELQRLLERTGAEARVSVRDPFAPLLSPAPAAGAASSSGSPTAPGTPSGLQAGPDAQARHDTHARPDSQAREQAPREQPAREQSRRQEPARPAYLTDPTPATGRLDRTV